MIYTAIAVMSKPITPGIPETALTETVNKLTGRVRGVNQESTCTAKSPLKPERAERITDFKNFLLLREAASIIIAEIISVEIKSTVLIFT